MEFRSDPVLTGPHPVVLFDGVCNLCNASVNFIIDRDPNKVFRFAALQSTVGQTLLKEYGLAPERLESVILIADGCLHQESDAVLQIIGLLSGPISLLKVGRFLPRNIRNFIYHRVAKNRYRWFGRRDQCRVPTSEERALFLQDPADLVQLSNSI